MTETFCLATTFTYVRIPCKIYSTNWVYFPSIKFDRQFIIFHFLLCLEFVLKIIIFIFNISQGISRFPCSFHYFVAFFCRFPIFWFFGFGCCMQLALPSSQYVAQKIIIIIYKRFCANQKLLPNCAKLNLLQLKTFIANFVCVFNSFFLFGLFVEWKCCLNNLSEVLRTC